MGADEGDDNIQVKPTPTQNAIDNDSKDTETQKIPFQRPLIKKKSWRKQGAGQCNDGKQLPWKEDDALWLLGFVCAPVAQAPLCDRHDTQLQVNAGQGSGALLSLGHSHALSRNSAARHPK